MKQNINTESKLESNDLLLRHVLPEDFDSYVSLATSSTHNPYSPLKKPTKEEAQTVIEVIMENYDSGKYEFWSVIDKKNNEYAGFIGYHPIQCDNKIQMMLFCGFRPRYWINNLPYEAAKLASKYAFSHNIQNLLAFIHPEDTRTLQLFEKSLFQSRSYSSSCCEAKLLSLFKS